MPSSSMEWQQLNAQNPQIFKNSVIKSVYCTTADCVCELEHNGSSSLDI